MKKKNKGAQLLGVVMASTFLIVIVFTIVQMSRTVSEIIKSEVAKTPDAILASVGIEEGMNVSLPVTYYDQKPDGCVDLYDINLSGLLRGRQFEWSKCDYTRKEVEEGIVEKKLNDQYMIVGKGGDLTPNKGLNNLTRWFSEVDGKSKSYNGVLKMNYDSEKSEFGFSSEEFYPLDGVEFGDGDYVNNDGHNHLFTMSFAVPFKALLSGEEEVEMSADDDTFMYVGKNLVIDMGGIHDVMTKKMRILRNGDLYVGEDGGEMNFSGINLGENRDSIIRVFHADRDSDNSVFKIRFTKMDLNVRNVKMADSGEDGVQIAYDDLDYIGPLGESLVVRPDNIKSKIVIAIIDGVVVLVLSVLLTSAIHFTFRARQQKVTKK